MSSNVFLAPCDSGNFDRTVRSTVNLAEYSDCPSALADKDEVRFWGAREGSGNEGYFEKMASGDLVLFYQDGEYVGTGWVETMLDDEARWASTTFWHGAPSRLIYTVEDFTELSVPKSVVNGVFDYVPDYNPQGLIRVADRRIEKSHRAIALALKRYSEKHG